MLDLPALQADLQALHESIDTESSLQDIRIAVLRALTRHRFFTEEFLKITGDWEPRVQSEEWDRRRQECIDNRKDELRLLVEGKGAKGFKDVKVLLDAQVPPLPEDISQRDRHPLGQLLKYIVHRIASVCLRDREEEAAQHWANQSRAFEAEAKAQQVEEMAQQILDRIDPEQVEKMRKMMEEVEKRMGPPEPGDDWLELDEVLGSDEAFEATRKRILKQDDQELELYAMILDRRLKLGNAYSGLDLILSQEFIPWPQEKPDAEPDPEREQLIQQLEELTGRSFRTK